MAKKKTVKKTAPDKQSAAPKRNAIDELVYENARVINVLEIRISLLNQRIDRIVEAHEKCKSLKGL